ncbi:membrane protein [Photobacterium leiognathi subsp. mandapamensis]|nr:membrane protein [Photobacterium leiognathi subsp. mandapamensis]
MKALILVAKLAIAFVWLVLLVNIVHPFPGVAAMALYIMTAFLFMMHGLQMLIFIGAFGDKINMSGWEKWSILIFGIFALLDIRRNHMM